MGRKKGSDSVDILSRQKLKRRNRKFSRGRVWAAVIGFGLVFLGVSGYFIQDSFGLLGGNSNPDSTGEQPSISKKPKNSNSSKDARVIGLALKTGSKEGFEKTSRKKLAPIKFIIKPGIKGRGKVSEIRKLLSIAIKAANDNPDNIIESISREIQVQSDYARVHAIWSSRSTIIITAVKRVPYLAIKADRTRFLTKNGVVYGEAVDKEVMTSLIHVSGIFSEKSSNGFILKSDNSIELSAEENSRIAELLELVRLAKQNGIEMTKIVFQKYRGFISLLKKDDIEVSFGRAPFQARFVRLQNILDNLKHRGILYSKIELDYDGKAFIKEKRL